MAERFTFHLEGLLQLRRSREQAAFGAFAKVRGDLAANTARLSSLKAALAAHNQAAYEAIMNGAGGTELYQSVACELRQAIADCSRQIEQQNLELNHCRGELLEAMNRRKLISKMKTAATMEHRKVGEKIQNAAQDGMYVAFTAAKTHSHE